MRHRLCVCPCPGTSLLCNLQQVILFLSLSFPYQQVKWMSGSCLFECTVTNSLVPFCFGKLMCLPFLQNGGCFLASVWTHGLPGRVPLIHSLHQPLGTKQESAGDCQDVPWWLEDCEFGPGEPEGKYILVPLWGQWDESGGGREDLVEVSPSSLPSFCLLHQACSSPDCST